MSEILLFVLVTLGAFISSLTGLGGGTLILAGLLLVFPASLAIPLHSFTQLTSNGLRTGLFFKQVHWRVVGAYALLMVPAAWFGAKLFNHINPDWLNVTVGLFILISVLPIRMKPKGEPRLKTFMILGGLSGFLGVFVGAVGPLVMPFFNRLKIERQGMLSTKSAGQTLLQLSKIIAFSGAGGVDFLQLKDNVLILILASLVGVGLSIPVSRKISDAKFDLILNVLLGLIAVKILYKGITGLL
jgi:uncharacterized membrane protein YfcA